MLDYGEGLPLYLPPVNLSPFLKGEKEVENKGKSLTLRYVSISFGMAGNSVVSGMPATFWS